MNRRAFLPFVLLAAGCHVRPESLVPAGALQSSGEPHEYLGASPASFWVVGGETSFAWPALLQDLLDDHAGQRGRYRVLNAARTAEPTEAGVPDGASLALLAPARSPEAERTARTALCLVSLRGIGDERGPVKSENDMVGAEMGADALERLALALRERGMERVVFATPLYAESPSPELGLERVALARLLARGHPFIEAGPDVFRASRRYYPDAYAEDRTQPNEFGAKLVAEEWYRWLAGPKADEGAVERLYSKDYDVEAIEAAQAELERAQRP